MMKDEHDCRRDGCAAGEPCDRDGGARVPAGHRSDPDEACPTKVLILNRTSFQKVYVRRSVAHVCVKGKTYGVPIGNTAVSTAAHVTVSLTVAESVDAVIVTQTLPMGSVAEVWSPVSF